MPDISLLQREYEVTREESQTASILFTVSIIFFIIFVGAYVGFYFYDSFLANEINTVNEEIAKTKVGESFKNVDQLNALKSKTNMLKSLRESHTSISKILSKFEQATHPQTLFTSGDFYLDSDSAKLKGSVSNTPALLRQIEIYTTNTAIKDFTLDNPGYTEDHTARITIDLMFNK